MSKTLRLATLVTVLLSIALVMPAAGAAVSWPFSRPMLTGPSATVGIAHENTAEAVGVALSPMMDAAAITEQAVQVAAGGWYTCAVASAGGVKCWGYNGDGQLGDGTTTDRWTPVAVSSLADGVQAVAVGGGHTCAVTSVGGVKCWGSNDHGQLGDGTYSDHMTPVDVKGLDNPVQAIATGFAHTCVLTTVGGVKCWGRNYSGELGDGANSNRTTPTDVIGLGSGVQALAVGGYHTCALTISGRVKCWGMNYNGQLGDGTTTNRWTPVDVSVMASAVQAITAGGWHTCALIVSGEVKCWGSNSYGQLGDGTYADRTTPVDVTGLADGAMAIAGGRWHVCILTTAGGVRCWGINSLGELGDGTRYSSSTIPVEVSGLTSGARAISAGDGHTCVLTTVGGVKCWGRNYSGELGNGSTTNRASAVDVSGLSSGVQASDASHSHTCALTTTGGIKCWGGNFSGQLGGAPSASRYRPADVSGLSSEMQAIATGTEHTCALTTAGGVKCWGGNVYGQLGSPNAKSYTIVDVSGLGSGVQAITAGDFHACALTTAGGVKCWGGNSNGQLGDGTTTTRSTPVNVSGLASGVQAIAAGEGHACALTNSGGVMCWGANSAGQLGDGTTVDRWTPVDVSELASGVQAIAAGGRHTCALTNSGAVKCWGANNGGQLGDSATTDRWMPIDVSGLVSGVQRISAGSSHTCVVTDSGGMKCWGANRDGQLGVNPGWTPVDVIGFEGAPPIAHGDGNGDGTIDAGDISALVLEIFDGDGAAPAAAPGGSFPGDPTGCDANADNLIDAGDISCTVLLIFNGPGACAAANASLSRDNPASSP